MSDQSTFGSEPALSGTIGQLIDMRCSRKQKNPPSRCGSNRMEKCTISWTSIAPLCGHLQPLLASVGQCASIKGQTNQSHWDPGSHDQHKLWCRWPKSIRFGRTQGDGNDSRITWQTVNCTGLTIIPDIPQGIGHRKSRQALASSLTSKKTGWKQSQTATTIGSAIQQ